MSSASEVSLSQSQLCKPTMIRAVSLAGGSRELTSVTADTAAVHPVVIMMDVSTRSRRCV